jgi:hypothetical protein
METKRYNPHQITDTCQTCGCQIWWDGLSWINNSGGDVCGVNGDNSPHVPLIPILPNA